MTTETIHPEILYFAPSDSTRTSVAEYAKSYVHNLSGFKEVLTILPMLSVNVPENWNQPDTAHEQLALVQRMTRDALAGVGRVNTQIIHVDLDRISRREFWAAYYAARQRPDCPLCIVFHDPPQLPELPRATELNEKSSFLERFLTIFTDSLASGAQDRMIEYFLERASVLMALSQRGANQLLQKYRRYERKIGFLPPVEIGSVPSDLEPDSRSVEVDAPVPPSGTEDMFNNVPTAHKTLLKPLEITFFSFLRPDKGIEQILEAIVLLSKKLQSPIKEHIHVRIRGRVPDNIADSGYIEGIEQLIQRLGLGEVVDFQPGFMKEKDVDKLLTQTHLLLLPYRPGSCNGVSMALLRSEAWCVAPVASDTGSMREYIENGKDGMLYAAGDCQELAECLHKFLLDRDLHKRIAQARRERALAERAPARVAGMMGVLYREMLAARDEKRLVNMPMEMRAQSVRYGTVK